MAGFSFDISTTSAILIGMSDYKYLSPVAPAINNVDDFEEILQDQKIIGLPLGKIVKRINLRNDELHELIIDFLENDENINTETLIFYFVGHGIRASNTKDLYLTGINSKPSSLRTSALSYNELKELIENSHIQNKIIILDACYSGLAALGESDHDKEINVKGSYTITSSPWDKKTFFTDQNRNTDFTAVLLDVLRRGIPIKQPYLSLESLFKQLKIRLKNAEPQRKNNLNVSDYYFIKNSQYDEVKIQLAAANKAFDKGEYKKALNIYLSLHFGRADLNIEEKIRLCKEYIAVIEKANKKTLAKPPEEKIKPLSIEIKPTQKKRVIKSRPHFKNIWIPFVMIIIGAGIFYTPRKNKAFDNKQTDTSKTSGTDTSKTPGTDTPKIPGTDTQRNFSTVQQANSLVDSTQSNSKTVGRKNSKVSDQEKVDEPKLTDISKFTRYGNIQFLEGGVLRTSSYPTLDAISADLRSSNQKVVIAGYVSTYEGEDYPSPESRLKLSRDYANSVKTYLVNAGVKAQNLKIKAYGDTYPIADDNTEEGRAANRRVTIYAFE